MGADLCRKHGISSATFYEWKAKYGGLEVSDAKRLRSLEDGNRRLKKLLAERRPHSALGNLTPIAYAARNASVPQQPGALRSTTGFAPQAVATPGLTGPNDERILLSTG